jgi:hypothetical protein
MMLSNHYNPMYHNGFAISSTEPFGTGLGEWV